MSRTDIFDSSRYYLQDGPQAEHARDLLVAEHEWDADFSTDEIAESDIFDRTMQLMRDDLEIELDELSQYLGFENLASCENRWQGETHPERNRCTGNTVLAFGTHGLWNGTVQGYTEAHDMEDLLFHTFRDCELNSIYDEDGDLHINGHHHDGRVEVAIRQLTDAGEEAWESWKETEETGGIEKIWNDPDLCPKLDYAKQELEIEEHPEADIEISEEER